MVIICTIPLVAKLDKCGLMLANPDKDQHVKCKSRFKYALRLIKNNENMLRKEALAKQLADFNPKAFWSEINNMNNCKTTLPISIGGGYLVEYRL